VNGWVERDESLDFSTIFGDVATPMGDSKKPSSSAPAQTAKPNGTRTVRTYVASPKKVDLELAAPEKKPKSPFWNFDIRNLANTVPLVVALVLGGTAVLQQKENADLVKKAEAAEAKYDALNGKPPPSPVRPRRWSLSVKTIVGTQRPTRTRECRTGRNVEIENRRTRYRARFDPIPNRKNFQGFHGETRFHRNLETERERFP
jgi:hypothetical protein